MPKLSAIIIAKDVAEEIVPALKSVAFADEVILVDTGSTDNTVTISQPYTTKIVHTSGHDFSQWRNLGAKEAKGEWLLYVDSDERIPVKLADEIVDVVSLPKYSAYTIPRYEVFLGRHLSHWGDPRVLRLIHRDELVKWSGKVHEQPIVKGKIGHLRHSMLHLSHKNIDEKVLNTLNWSKLEAKMLFDASHPKMVGWRFFSVIVREFMYRFVHQALWKDGTEGVIEVIYQMFSKFITYVRLWEMQRQPSLGETYKDIDKKLLNQIKVKP